MRALLSLDGQSIVLDAGCGIGEFSNSIAGRVRTTIGVDFSKEMVKFARANVSRDHQKNSEFFICDIKKMPFKDDWLNRIVCSSVFQYMSLRSVAETLQELKRMSRDGAIMVLHIKNSISLQGCPYIFRPHILLRLIIREIAKTMMRSGMSASNGEPSFQYRAPATYKSLIKRLKIGLIEDESSFGLWSGNATVGQIDRIAGFESFLFERRVRYIFGAEYYIVVKVTKSGIEQKR
jgi:SAM-dependent methyltransferase